MKRKLQKIALMFLCLISNLGSIKSMHLDEIENDKFLNGISNLDDDDKGILINILVNSDGIDSNKLAQIINVIKNRNEDKITDENEIMALAKNLNPSEKNRFLNLLINFNAIEKKLFFQKIKLLKQNPRMLINDENLKIEKPLLITESNHRNRVIRNANVNKFDVRRAQKIKAAGKKYEKENPTNANVAQRAQPAQVDETEQEYNLTSLFGNTEVIPDQPIQDPQNLDNQNILPKVEVDRRKSSNQRNNLQANPKIVIENKSIKSFWSNQKKLALAVLIAGVSGILIYTYFIKKNYQHNN